MDPTRESSHPALSLVPQMKRKEAGPVKETTTTSAADPVATEATVNRTEDNNNHNCPITTGASKTLLPRVQTKEGGRRKDIVFDVVTAEVDVHVDANLDVDVERCGSIQM
mmetsp:Transcript_9973/g.21436  ORF Transcript_9973/g.21436 Transcript_9973/m.21436 type:complete len:110 (+) Transcript_9973:1238-1567(+)